MNSTSVPTQACAVPDHLSSGAFSQLHLEDENRALHALHWVQPAMTADPIFDFIVASPSATGKMHRVSLSCALLIMIFALEVEPKRPISGVGHSFSQHLGPMQNAAARWLKEHLQ